MNETVYSWTSIQSNSCYAPTLNGHLVIKSNAMRAQLSGETKKNCISVWVQNKWVKGKSKGNGFEFKLS